MIIMDINYRNIGFRVGQRRRELKLTQKEVAETIGVTDKYVSNIETGKRKINLDLIAEFCDIYNVTPDYFLLGNIRKDIDSNIIDNIKLCSEDDKKLIYAMSAFCAQRNK